MCGIIGYVSNENIVKKLINGLENLEYRGYDSSGIALLNNSLEVYKDQGKIENLKKLIPNNIFSTIGIGHTRWATTGIPSKENAHPHLSNNGLFALVHNGIIENYQEIKNKYLKKINLKSSTDTEIVCNLIEVLFNGNVIDTLLKVKKIIKGSYAFNLLYLKEKRIYFMKNKTPLVIGKNNNEFALASDALAFKNINQVYFLQDNDLGYIEQNNAYIYQKKEIKFKKINYLKSNFKNNFSFYMEKEIYEQITLIDQLINNYFENDKIKFSQKIKTLIDNANKIYLVACGSSYYSSLLGKYYFEDILKKEVEVVLASEALYHFPLIKNNNLFMFVSQSGETLDVLNVIKLCKNKHIPIIGITNSFNSSITHLCKNILYIYAGSEKAVASTKAFLGQSLLFYILCNYNKNLKKDFLALKKEIKRILLNKKEIESFSLTLKDYKDVFYLGRNIDYYIALEASLKLKEISYIHAEAFSSGELKHGTLALIDSNSAVIGLISQNNLSSIVRTNLQEAEVRGGKIFTIAKKNLSKNDTFIFNNLNKYLSCYGELIIVQLIAFYTALHKGYDVDKPRNLAKSVTVE